MHIKKKRINRWIIITVLFLVFLFAVIYTGYVPAADDNLASAAREVKSATYRTPGNTVTFGHYEQDNNTANGPEEIEWIVLDYDEKEHKVLLLSRYALDAIPYNTERVDTTWEKCSLRNWLNGEFRQSAFSAEEQAAILTTTVDNSDSQGYSKWSPAGGNNTQDQIFLLSYAEANRYLDVTYDDTNNTKARVAPTAYAIAKGAWTCAMAEESWTNSDCQTADGDAAGLWWLRSTRANQLSAAFVDESGWFIDHYVNSEIIGVRPAFWLNLESGIF